MKHLTGPELRELALDIEVELEKMARLRAEIEQLSRNINSAPEFARQFQENQAFKLHDFYNGCERIFRIVASELNGALPTGYDWHKRLLDRMAVAHEGRPAFISNETTRMLEKYLGFRHVVRNIYGFELEIERVAQLVAQQPTVWEKFEADARQFVEWLRKIADQLA